MTALAKGFHRDLLEPGLSLFGFALANLVQAVTVIRARKSGAWYLGKQIVPGVVTARHKERIAGRHGVISDAFERRTFGRFSGNQVRHDGGAGLAFAMRSGRGFGNTTADDRVANDMNIGHEF